MKKFTLRLLLIFWGCFFMQAYSKAKFDIFAHRGASGYEVENSMAAFKKALQLGSNFAELDVYKLKTGEIVVFHDKNVFRLTGVDAKIESFSYRDLKKLRLPNGEQIPLLKDVIHLLSNKLVLNIELKGKNTAASVNDLIKSEGIPETNFIISSSVWSELKKMRTLNKRIPIGVITEEDPIKAINIAKELNAISINPNCKKINSQNVHEILKQGFKVYCWTANNADEMIALKKLGVSGVFSNYPDRVKIVN